MSLITEDGSGVAGAESYITVADATTYHAARGNAAWAALASDTVREQLLRDATDYMLGEYRPRWKGVRAGTTQRLDWPRFNVRLDDVGFGGYAAYVPTATVPAEVQNACAELALRAASGPLAPDLKRQVIAKTIGPIRTEWQAGAPEYTRFRAVDLMLRALLMPAGAQLVRS